MAVRKPDDSLNHLFIQIKFCTNCSTLLLVFLKQAVKAMQSTEGWGWKGFVISQPGKLFELDACHKTYDMFSGVGRRPGGGFHRSLGIPAKATHCF